MPWDLPAGFLTEMRNVRISRNKLSPLGGYASWATLPVDFIPGYNIYAGSLSALYWVIAGKDAVYAFNSGSFTEISNVAGYAGLVDEDLWTGCMLSEILVLSNPSVFPEYWPQRSPSTKLESLPWDATNTWEDVSEQCGIILSHKQFLFALGIVSNGIESEDAVRWSSPADSGGLPATWDPFDLTDFAGIAYLGGGGGKIVDGLSLRDSFVVYRENGITVFDFIGGQFVWQIRHLSTTSGLVSQECIVEVKGFHYFISEGDILINDGNSIKSMLHDKIRKRFVDNYDSENYARSYTIKNSVFNEIWFCIPEAGHEYPNVAYIYNWEDVSWTVRDIPEVPFANYGPKKDTTISWDNINLNWGEASQSWNLNNSSPLDSTIIAISKPAGAGQSGELLLLDTSLVNSEVDFSTVIERVGLPLGGLENANTIQEIYPHMSGDGPVLIQIGSQDFPGSAIRWKPAVEFVPSTDRKIDVRTTGTLHCFRITSENNAKWDFSGMDIKYVKAGMR